MQRCTKLANTRRKIVLAITSHAIIHAFNTFSLAFTLLTLYSYHRSAVQEKTDMACTITFRAKRRKEEYYGHPELHSEYIAVPKIKREHCNMDQFRTDAKFGGVSNSDLFEAFLRRELKALGIGDRLKFEDQFGRYAIPACVTIKLGFLDEVTITL
jgi:hypothetical protein